MAIAILGWPIDKLPAEVARQVVEGGRKACAEAGIALAGGHSIDAPEPIFGLAVTGRVEAERVRRNSTAAVGCQLMLSKPLGIGIMTTAQKKKILRAEDQGKAEALMCQLNSLGAELSKVDGVLAMTDVTGFGLFGHLNEMCQAADVSAVLDFSEVPRIPEAEYYRQQGAIPGGTGRNFASYGEAIGQLTEQQLHYGCDPQTSGGLLIAVRPEAISKVQQLAARQGIQMTPFGEIVAARDTRIIVE